MKMDDGMQPVVVNVGACRCIGGPDTPHPDGDEVYLAPEASMTLGLHANGAIAAATSLDENGEPRNDPALMELLLGRVFIEYGIVGWNFMADGKPVPFVRDARDEPMPQTKMDIQRLLPWGRGGSLVGERANDLYAEAVLSPLQRKSPPPPQPGPTGDSTSPSPSSPQRPRSSSKSSSPVPSEMPG
jgi:hypothetical protein